MSTFSRIALAAAVFIAAAVVGLNLQGGQLFIGGPGPTPSPSPSPSPSPTPPGLPPSGELDAGTYHVPAGVAGKAFTLTVPDGWRADGAAVAKNADGPPFGDDDALFAAWNVTHVPGDACRWQSTMVEAGTTADELASLLAAQQGRETSRPADVTVSGHAAKLVELGPPPTDTDPAQCDDGFLRVWPDTGGSESGGWPVSSGQTDRIYAVDVEGTRVVLLATTYPDTPAADANELQAIVDSVRFQP